MRRRVDSELNDTTTKPYLCLHEEYGKLCLERPDRVLYDEALWSELLEARQRLSEVEIRVAAALVDEPLDGVEIDLGRKLSRMVSDADPYDVEEWDRIQDALIEHAKTIFLGKLGADVRGERI